MLQVNADEEVGSASRRGRSPKKPRARARAVLVLEPSQGLDGKLKTARKGVGDYTVTVHGRAAHAGLDFANGASAIVEMARQIERIAGFTRLDRGITVSPGVIRGGTREQRHRRRNATSRSTCASPKPADARYLERQFASLKPFDKRCTISVTRRR